MLRTRRFSLRDLVAVFSWSDGALGVQGSLPIGLPADFNGESRLTGRALFRRLNAGVALYPLMALP